MHHKFSLVCILCMTRFVMHCRITNSVSVNIFSCDNEKLNIKEEVSCVKTSPPQSCHANQNGKNVSHAELHEKHFLVGFRNLSCSNQHAAQLAKQECTTGPNLSCAAAKACRFILQIFQLDYLWGGDVFTNDRKR